MQFLATDARKNNNKSKIFEKTKFEHIETCQTLVLAVSKRVRWGYFFCVQKRKIVLTRFMHTMALNHQINEDCMHIKTTITSTRTKPNKEKKSLLHETRPIFQQKNITYRLIGDGGTGFLIISNKSITSGDDVYCILAPRNSRNSTPRNNSQ